MISESRLRKYTQHHILTPLFINFDRIIQNQFFLYYISSLKQFKGSYWNIKQLLIPKMKKDCRVLRLPISSWMESVWGGFSQWKTVFHFNVVSHWLSPYPIWSLLRAKQNGRYFQCISLKVFWFNLISLTYIPSANKSGFIQIMVCSWPARRH